MDKLSGCGESEKGVYFGSSSGPQLETFLIFFTPTALIAF